MKENDVRHTFRFLGHKTETEIRIIDAGTGHAQSLFVYSEDEFVDVCRRFEGVANVYVGMNERRSGGTKSADVLSIDCIVIDIDSVRAPGLAATDKELAKAKKVVNAVHNYLSSMGKKPYMAMSGNGWQLWLKVHIPLDDKDRKRFETAMRLFHRGLQERFNCAHAKIDNMADLARVIKVIGTKAIKNTTTRDRHNRFSKWMNFPESVEPDVRWGERIRELASNVRVEEVRVCDTSAFGGEIDGAKMLTLMGRLDGKGQDLMRGNWYVYGYASRSEAELALLVKMYLVGIPKEDAYKMMCKSKIGKWLGANQEYRDRSLAKAYTFRQN